MERTDRPPPVRDSPGAVGQDGAPALRVAAAILARATADEAAADAARERYRTQGMPPHDADERIAPLLLPDERVVAQRRAVAFDRRRPVGDSDAHAGVGGQLYVTSRRLVLVGRLTLSFELTEIEEAVLSGERLLLVFHDGTGVALDTEQPRLLRVEIAAARAYARGGSAGPPSSDAR